MTTRADVDNADRARPRHPQPDPRAPSFSVTGPVRELGAERGPRLAQAGRRRRVPLGLSPRNLPARIELVRVLEGLRGHRMLDVPCAAEWPSKLGAVRNARDPDIATHGNPHNAAGPRGGGCLTTECAMRCASTRDRKSVV